MTAAPLPRVSLRWVDLLSPSDIRSWTLGHKMPTHLHGKLSFPAVYRFVFQEFKDENGNHTLCYVGEAGRLGRRLSSTIFGQAMRSGAINAAN